VRGAALIKSGTKRIIRSNATRVAMGDEILTTGATLRLRLAPHEHAAALNVFACRQLIRYSRAKIS
jgi:hypothetical protein